MGKRRKAREMAMQMLYQHELGGSPLAEIFSCFEVQGCVDDADVAESSPGGGQPAEAAAAIDPEEVRRARKSFAYARRLVAGTVENRSAIDDLIRRHAENWRLERMPAIDRNILRLAVYEMVHETSVPKVVIVDEAIELAKKFGSEQSGRFVNGLLDGVLQANEASPQPARQDR